MQQDLSALDLHYLIEELQFMVGSKIDKIYQANRRNFYFRFFVTGKGNQTIKLQIPKMIYITDKAYNLPERPMGYCTFLRKYLSNARLREIRQHGFDRVIELVFTKKDHEEDEKINELILVIEMFNPGNMILCKEDYIIISPLEGKDWSNRSIRKGLKYEFPPEMEDIYHMDYESFKGLIEKSDKESIVKTLAMDLGLGGVYAEEVCFGVTEKAKKELDESEIQKLFDSFTELIHRKPRPLIYSGKKGFPFALRSFQGEFVEKESFSAVLNSLIKEKEPKKENKYEKIIEKQQENLVNIEIQAEENTSIGNTIYNNYIQVREILDDINKMRKEKGWDAVKDKYKESKIVTEIDSSTGKIVIDLD